MNDRLRLALHDIALAFGCWVIAFVVALTPLVIAIVLIRFAVQRLG